MSRLTHQRIDRELDLIERLSRVYQSQFAELISELNTAPTNQTTGQCLRLCVEAVNMLLDSHNQLASAMRSLAEEARSARPAC